MHQLQNNFLIKDFAQKCITIACKTDLIETKILIQTQNTPNKCVSTTTDTINLLVLSVTIQSDNHFNIEYK